MNTDKKSIKDRFVDFLKTSFQKLTKKQIITGVCLEIFFVIAMIVADVLTKQYIYGGIVESGKDIILIKDVLRFTDVQNTGASWGIFKDKTFILGIISAVSSVLWLIFMGFSFYNRNGFLRSGLVLVLAGGIGNLIDRVALHYVRDFIYFELIDFPVFNVADSCITIGIICILIYVIFYYKPSDSKNKRTK